MLLFTPTSQNSQSVTGTKTSAKEAIALDMVSSMRTFCSSGALVMMSVMNEGNNSVTRLTPAAKVPSDADDPIVCPALRACSTHARVTESTT